MSLLCKQKTADEVRISDWISDVCSSDLPGYLVPLTVVRDVEEGSAIVDEEPFGPILPIIRYSDMDDVIARANASPFALRSEERRVGNECVSTCRSRWVPLP